MDPKEHRESSEQLEQNGSDPASHTKSCSSSSDSSSHTDVVERDMLHDALPPTHTMGRPPGYDPNRIPASVFASRPSTPMEWSVASNESLFSIQVGNSSFSKDQYSMMMNRAEEFPRLDEHYNPPTGLLSVIETEDSNIKHDNKENRQRVLETSAESTKAVSIEPAVDNSKDRMSPADDTRNYVSSPVVVRQPAIDNSKDVMPPADDVPHYISSIVVARQSAIDNSKGRMPPVDEASNYVSSPVVSCGLAINNSKDRTPPADDALNYVSSPVVARMSTSPSEDHRNSDGSVVSTQSFAFPTFTGDGGRSSSAKVDSAKQPSTPTMQSESQQEPEPEPQPQSRKQSQPGALKGFPRPAENSWFSWFSCFSCCAFCN